VAFTYLQGVLGGLIRHFNASNGYRLHLLVAFAVVAAVVWLWRTGRDASGREIRRPLGAIALLLVMQLGLGVEALMIRFAPGMPFDLTSVTPAQAWIRTAHFVCAALILALSVV